MTTEQASQIKLDEHSRYSDRAWITIENQNQNELDDDVVAVRNEAKPTQLEGLFHVGQDVFLSGNQSVGRIQKLIPGPRGQITYLIVRTSRILGHEKILPVEHVNSVSPKGVSLSIDRSNLTELPDYKTDGEITDDVENALFHNAILRVTDFYAIDVWVKNGVVTLTGYISGMMNQERVKSALKKIKGILGVRNHLVMDDKLLLKVSKALFEFDRIEGNQIFAKVENGVVVLSGKVINAENRRLAEQCVSNIFWVRGVINNLAAPGIDLKAVDQRFIQPAIGEKIYFHDGPFGVVKQVVINPDNRRVVGMIIKGRFSNTQQNAGSMISDEYLKPERLAFIPVRVIRYSTKFSGFLLIDSTETTQYQDFNPTSFSAPEADWGAPYPYSIDDVLLLVD